MRRHTFALLLALLFVSTGPASAIVVSLGFQQPVATTFDGAGFLYVLDTAGTISKVTLTPQPSVVATFGSEGSGDGQLSKPQDLALDHDGNIVVADSRNMRLEVFSTSGTFVRVAACAETPQRVVAGPDGTLYVLEYDGTGLAVERFNASYQSLGTFDVSATCSVRSNPSYTAALAVDAAGYVWVADHIGCGENYALRRYSADGMSSGSWSRLAGEISSDTLAAKNYEVCLISDLVTAGGNIYVIMGTGGAETGGMNADVWTTGGTYLRRAAFAGPARPMVRGTVNGGNLYVTDTFGNKTIVGVALQSL